VNVLWPSVFLFGSTVEKEQSFILVSITNYQGWIQDFFKGRGKRECGWYPAATKSMGNAPGMLQFENDTRNLNKNNATK